MLRLIQADGVSEIELYNEMRGRARIANADVTASVAAIMTDVERRGFEAVREYSLEFDGAEPREILPDEIERAYCECDTRVVKALEQAARNIRDYQERLLVASTEWRSSDGVTLGCMVRGMERVGIYVPGGTAAYPSSVLMNAIPARVAGVGEVIMVTPPTSFLNNAVLAAAKIAGIDRVFAVGGAQAIAALTYGAGYIQSVDKIVGPGNAYVAAAKRMAYGRVDIDIEAGPSEVLVIADETANPVYVAADLLSQAEHDALSSAVLVTDSATLAESVISEVNRQAILLARREIIQKSLDGYGAVIVCESMEAACDIANHFAPEHLEIVTAEPRSLLPLIKNAGAIFLGKYTPEPVGDYIAGPSHILPTSGTARFSSPLSVDSFLKKTSVIEYTAQALADASSDIITLAEAEQLTAHANAVRVRMERGK